MLYALALFSHIHSNMMASNVNVLWRNRYFFKI